MSFFTCSSCDVSDNDSSPKSLSPRMKRVHAKPPFHMQHLKQKHHISVWFDKCWPWESNKVNLDNQLPALNIYKWKKIAVNEFIELIKAQSRFTPSPYISSPGSASFTIKRSILPPLPPNKFRLEAQSKFDNTAHKVLYVVTLSVVPVHM